MRINIVWGNSEGKTLISAFDRSLAQAGIHNLNLIRLSSVIPAGAEVAVAGINTCHYKVGDICYVVLSSFSSNKPNTQITAGLGWVQTDYGGLFFESSGECNPEECEEEIRKGLKDMMSARNWNGEIKVKLVTHTVKEAANVTVAAVYDFGQRENKFGILDEH